MGSRSIPRPSQSPGDQARQRGSCECESGSPLKNEHKLDGKWPFRCVTEKMRDGWRGVWIDLSDLERAHTDHSYPSEAGALKAAEIAFGTAGRRKYNSKAGAELDALARGFFG